MELLLDTGDFVDVNASCPHGRRPIHMVLTALSRPNSQTCLKFLLDHGAQPNVTTDEGVTPLHLAAAEGLRECTEILVRNKADTNVRDNRGHTPLDLARIWGYKDIARFLKDAMWKKDKEQEMEKLKQLHNLRQDLVRMHTMAESKDKMIRLAVKKQELSVWTTRAGCSPTKHAINVKQSSRHAKCLLTEVKMPNSRTKYHPGTPKEKWNISPIPSKPPPGSISRSQGVRMGTHPEELPSEPDLSCTVTLGCWKNGRPRYIASQDGISHLLPDLPLNILLKALFPSAFPSRIDSPQHFQSSSVLDLPRLGQSLKADASLWTEVAMHLAEELQPGHY
nr:ankyrin repeat domain-containing protein 53 [Misgurnus anguillicaudatus]